MFPQALSSFFTFFNQFTLLVFGVLLVNSFIACFAHLNLPLSMALFKHPHFLCCSMPSFGVSTTSPKNSSSFNVSPLYIAIIFITYRNRQHLKNNKGNTNNSSVIIFLKVKNSQRCYFAWVVILLFFIFDLHFVVVSSFVDVFYFVVVLDSHFLFDVIPHPSVDFRPVLAPIL